MHYEGNEGKDRGSDQEKMKKIGFVTPWYGEEIPGGAEAELRGVVHHLKDAGAPVEVLTTCVKSFASDWNENFHPAGLTEEAGIPVRRFPVRKRDTKAFDAVNYRLINGRTLTNEEEETFCREMINSPELYDYMREHDEEYGLYFFIPYMFGTTVYGCQIRPGKSFLIPCLHDEEYAYMRCLRQPFAQAAGMVFNAEPERRLAEKLYGVRGETFTTFGIGMETDWKSDPARFRAKYGIRDPFILYAGRKEAGKRVDLLIRYFTDYKERNPGNLKLVLIGGGEIEIPEGGDIIDLGFVEKQDKYDAYGAAELFCNPSEMESFSLVIMESWLAGRPVLVNGKCAVTKDFVRQTGGGLYFENYMEFEGSVSYLTEQKETAAKMGRKGRRYVTEHFDWNVITKKYLQLINKA